MRQLYLTGGFVDRASKSNKKAFKPIFWKKAATPIYILKTTDNGQMPGSSL